jgi:hypothetical protein
MACSGLGAFGSEELNGRGRDEFDDEAVVFRLKEVQFVVIAEMREMSVVLSDKTWKVVGERVELEDVEVLETNVDVIIGPPGRDELSGEPYSAVCRYAAPVPPAAPPQTTGQKKNGNPFPPTPLPGPPVGYPLPYTLVPNT